MTTTNNALLATVGIVLQYTLIVLIYYFLWRVIAIAWRDIRQIQEDKPILCSTIASLPARLIVTDPLDSETPGKVYLIAESLSIGRSDHNDVVVNDTFVSSEHACITISKHTCILTDLASTNGTYLNDRKVESDMPLESGDRIVIGSVTFKFER